MKLRSSTNIIINERPRTKADWVRSFKFFIRTKMFRSHFHASIRSHFQGAKSANASAEDWTIKLGSTELPESWKEIMLG